MNLVYLLAAFLLGAFIVVAGYAALVLHLRDEPSVNRDEPVEIPPL